MGRTGRTSVIVIALMCAASSGIAQWLRYPTEGVPRKPDGTPNLAAPAPRLSGGKPDFSGVWHAGNRVPCTPEISRFIDCGTEIGGSKQTLDLGVDLPGGSLPYQPWAADLK